MPQYQGGFYTGQQAAGDVLREILQGLRVGRRDGLAAREQQQLQRDRADERAYVRGRDEKADARLMMQDAAAAEERKIRDAQVLADLRNRGVFRGAAPQNITEAVDLTGIGGVGRSFVQDPKRYSQLTDGFYVDDAQTPETKARVLSESNKRAIARITQRLSNGDSSVIGEAAALGLNPNDYDPTKRAGTPQYLAAKRAELNLEDEYSARANARQVAGQLRVAGSQRPVSDTPRFGDVMQFRSQYAGDPTVKAATEVASSVAVARKAAAGDTGISDVSLVYAAAKAFDPGSVVREGEFATIEKSQSIPQRVLSMARRADSGKRLTPEMRADLVQAIEDRGAAMRTALQPVRQRFGGLAQTYGLPLNQTVYDPFDDLGIQSTPRKPLSARDVPGLELRKR